MMDPANHLRALMDPTEHPGGGPASASDDRQQQTPAPFLGGRKPTPRSVRIVSMQDSNAATSAVLLVLLVVGRIKGQIGRRQHG